MDEGAPAGRGSTPRSCDALVFARVVGLGLLPLPAAVGLVRAASAHQRRALDAESLWREMLLQQFAGLPLEGAGLPSLARLMARQPPKCGLVITDPKATCSLMWPHGRGGLSVDWEASVLVVGPPRSGKTWLVHRLCQGSAPERLDGATVLGCDMRAALVQLPDGRAGDTLLGRLRIWEPSGSSREQALGGYLRSSVAVVVVARAGDPAAGREARELLRRVRGAMRPGTALALAASQADLVSPRDSAGAAAVAGLRAAAGAAGADFALCSAVTGEGVEGLFAAALAACRERGALAACRGRPVLSCEAGQLSNSELLRALLLHRR